MNGAEAVLTSLKNEGVDVVFGYPGGAVLTLYDAVYKMNFPHIHPPLRVAGITFRRKKLRRS